MLEFRQIVSQAQLGDITALTEWGFRFTPVSRLLLHSYVLPSQLQLHPAECLGINGSKSSIWFRDSIATE